MSIQEDQELRERLDTLLSGIEPRPAPVALAMRRGKGIRIRRWMASAAGILVVAGGVALPVLLHAGRSQSAPIPPLRYSVTVHAPGKNAHAGLIAYGTENGHGWQVVISGSGMNETLGGNETSFVSLSSVADVGPGPVTVLSVGGPGGATTLAGVVASNVTTVAITLPEGRVFTLKPVRYLRQRFVAIVIPTSVPIVGAVAYHGTRKLAYSVPYDGNGLLNWWHIGQAGPGRFTKTIASGIADGQAWRYVAQFGPWGYCYTTPGGSACLEGTKPTGILGPRTTVTMMACGRLGNGGPRNPTSVLASVPANVRQVALQFSGGSTDRVRAVDVKGAWLIGYAFPAGKSVLRAYTYDAAGRMLGITPGVGLSCQA